MEAGKEPAIGSPAGSAVHGGVFDVWDILFHVFVIIALPLVFALAAQRGGRTRWEWWSNTALVLAVTGWAFVAGRWDMAGYYFRFLLPIAVAITVYAGWRRVRRFGNELPKGRVGSFSVLLNLVLTVTFAAQVGIGLSGYFTADEAIELNFPLKGGIYHVGQGGSTVLVNYHSSYAPQAYALDIGRLNRLGYRAAGLYPRELEKYEIFGDVLYSPCTGVVAAARDGLPDYEPPERDPEHPEGNFVTIRCDDAIDVNVILAHMQQHSVLVNEGDVVTVGQPIGKVGNSGNTTEPHLHIHAERLVELPDGTEEWMGVPIRFNGRFLARNNLVVTPAEPASQVW